MSSDPFLTPTAARIYAQQGKLDEAREIYRKLVAQNPSDHGLGRELAEVERKLAEGQQQQADSSDSVTVEASDDEQLRCRWFVTDEGAERARMVLGTELGTLTLRVVGFPQDPELSVRDTPLSSSLGAVKVTPPAGAELVAASVGLLSDQGTFVSIAHCDMVELR